MIDEMLPDEEEMPAHPPVESSIKPPKEIQEIKSKTFTNDLEMPHPAPLSKSYNEDFTSKDINEKGTAFVEACAIQKATENKVAMQKITDIKTEQITDSVMANKEIMKAKRDAEKITALTEKDVAFYNRWKSVLNFGGIDEPQNKVLSVIIICLLMPLYLAVTILIKLPFKILNILLCAINTLIETIAKFGKAARSIAVSVCILLLLALIFYIIYFFLNKYGIINAIKI